MRLLFDIETNGLLRETDRVHCLWIKDLDSGQMHSFTQADMCNGLAMLEEADELVGHNILTFDLPALKKVYPNFNPQANVLDTLVMSRLIWADENRLRLQDTYNAPMPPKFYGNHSLQAWGYRLGVLKGGFNNEKTDWSQWTPEMHDYCRQDVVVNEALLKKILARNYSQEAIRLEHEFAWVIFQQEEHGFCFDEPAAVKLYTELLEKQKQLTEQLQALFPPEIEVMKTPEYWLELASGTKELRFPTKAAAKAAGYPNAYRGPLRTKTHPFNPGSRVQIAKRLREKGWVPTKFTPSGQPQVDETILEELPYPEAKPLFHYLLIGKMLGQLAEGDQALLKVARNGRIHGRVITNGCVSGRCSHYAPNVAQTPRVVKTKAGVLRGLEGRFGWEFRSLYRADPGKVLVGADASGLELRCLAHYMAPFDGGKYAKEVVEGDVHTANMLAAGLDSRDDAKTFIYAHNYGAGDEKLGAIGGWKLGEQEALKASEPELWAQAEERLRKKKRPLEVPTIAAIVRGAKRRAQFLDKTPALAKLREAIEFKVWGGPKPQSFRERASRKLQPLRGLDGRLLAVRSDHASLNVLLQSAGALLVKKGTTILYNHLLEKGWTFGKEFALVAHIHDEIQLQTLPQHAEEVGRLAVQSFAEAGEFFRFRCPITGEFRIGETWSSTH